MLHTVIDRAGPRGGLKKALEMLVPPAQDARGRAFGGRRYRLPILLAHLIHQVPLCRRGVSSRPARKVGERAIWAGGVLVPELLNDWLGQVKEGRRLEEGGCFP